MNVNGRIRVIIRLRIDGMATAHMCAICDVDDDVDTLNLRFTQFYPLPGGQNYFHIIRDENTGYFWMTASLPTNSQDSEWGRNLDAQGFLGDPGNRKTLPIFILQPGRIELVSSRMYRNVAKPTPEF